MYPHTKQETSLQVQRLTHKSLLCMPEWRHLADVVTGRGIVSLRMKRDSGSRIGKWARGKALAAGLFAASAVWPNNAAQAKSVQQLPQRASLTEMTDGQSCTSTASFERTVAGGKRLAFIPASTKKQIPLKSPALNMPSKKVLAGAAVLAAGSVAVSTAKSGESAVEGVEVRIHSTRGKSPLDEKCRTSPDLVLLQGEENTGMPHPLFDAFDECAGLEARELVMSSWKGTILETGPNTMMQKKQSVASALSAVSGWFGKSFGIDNQCQALVMKMGSMSKRPLCESL
jgi:hypothetical protein